MDLFAPSVWWVAAGLAVVAELATGTIYLLMVALGLCAGALAAHFGMTQPLQLMTAAIVGGGATALWHGWRISRDRTALPAGRSRDVNLDVGERVNVAAWSGDGTARVSYRGSTWSARLQPGSPATAGEHVVVSLEGNWLILAPATPP